MKTRAQSKWRKTQYPQRHSPPMKKLWDVTKSKNQEQESAFGNKKYDTNKKLNK